MTMPTTPELDQGLAEVVALASANAAEPAPDPPNDQVAPNPHEPDGSTVAEQRRAIMRAMYGDSFPPASENPATSKDPAQWSPWIVELWNSRRAAWARHLHLVQRNRMYRAGLQWVSAAQGRAWAVKPAPADAVRAVVNMVDKALDQRLQILAEQRPGFSISPMTMDPDDKRRAIARQMACEFQFEQMQMFEKGKEAGYWAQTDGVSFWHMFWNVNRGPVSDALDGVPAPIGDCDCHVLRVEQIRAAPNATATIPPSWVIVREVISVAEAAARHGYTGLQAAGSSQSTGRTLGPSSGMEAGSEWALAMTVPGEGDRLRDTDTVERFTFYAAPQPGILPNGLEAIVVGDRLVYGPTDLKFGRIPIVPVRDGSTDPSYLPRPTMEQWVDSQTRVNALVSKWIENIRVNSGGRFFTRPNTTVTETFIGGLTSMIEVSGAGALDEAIKPFQGFSVGNDTKELLALEIKAFEDASGWNAVSRGQVTGESGRAILASREQLERVFAPPVQSLAKSYTEWCGVVLDMMKWGYDIPRTLGAVGKSRPDLARQIGGDDLDGAADVKVEPATMMPMPFSFRMFILDKWLEAGIIDVKEYRRRQAFAIARDVTTPDEDQEARAKRISDAIVLGVPFESLPPIRWQDDESIHQDVLERDIILQDDLPPDVIAVAEARWTALAEQSALKQQMLMPAMGPDQGSPGDTPRKLAQLPPERRPLSAMNPAIPSAPMLATDDETNARRFDAINPQ